MGRKVPVLRMMVMFEEFMVGGAAFARI